MVILTAAAAPGSYHLDAEINQVTKPTGAGTDYAIGTVVFLDPADDTFKPTPADGTARAPFGVVVNKVPATTDTLMDVALSGHVTVTASGAIARHNFVSAGGAIGRVVEYAATGSPTAGTAATEALRIVGRYIGKADGNERDGVAKTAAADGNVVWIKLGLGGGGF